MRSAQRPRTIPRLVGGPDKRATDLNNALSVLVEFVSPKRLATLATIPTAAAVIAAADLYLTCESNPELIRYARALRTAAETWTSGQEVPSGIHAAARAIFTVLGPEPPRGWDEEDGYYHPEVPPRTASAPGQRPPERAAEIAQTTLHAAQITMCAMNLAALLASPRVLRKAHEAPTRDDLLEHLDALLGVFSSGALSSPVVSVVAVRDATRRLREACAEWTPSFEAPLEVRQAARALLGGFAVSEPPEGWDAFEGGHSH
jgi:hypothetical protein